ncbi:RDD family protein [Draconibacterium sp. IB214405]|uniref:RDD family protein n=1 Tax=Draconibacterium sp. IB214405 TaxID=3097352 RepID=UPI002A17CF3E|nr:RDD family protein [Draconibacterium sp. IB214405]MDX8340901.1 RDD family protein [Draconibacterium sp. IB214405]
MKKHTNTPTNKKDFSGSATHSIIRLLNFIIDTVIWLCLYFSAAYIFDLYFVRFSSYVINYLYSIALGLLIYLAYYAVLEFYFRKTLGKFLTGTQVVRGDGGRITFSTIVIRTLSRLIPIDILTYLFAKNGLHDRLSNTQVIKTKS